MKALYDDLCLNGHDEFIKLTTVYPAFVSTQKSLTNLIGSVSDMPFFDPDFIGDLIVKGMLLNRREFVVPSSSTLFFFLRYFKVEIFFFNLL
jgi:hypothetical protein